MACIQGEEDGLHPGWRGSASGWGWSDPPSDTTGYGQRAGGMHPTGMHLI